MNTNFKSKLVETQKLHMTKHCKVVEDEEHLLLSCKNNETWRDSFKTYCKSKYDFNITLIVKS